jgi:hypothetical protein
MFYPIVIARIALFYSVFLLFFSCSSNGQNSKRGIVRAITHFYNEKGKSTFTHYLKIWYHDSIAIQEIRGVTTVTSSEDTTVTYPLLFCRYMDLRSKMIYDYTSFSDTAGLIEQASLPDSLLDGPGWSFYSEKAPKIQGTPELLADTVIDNISYRRAKFSYTWYDPKKIFLIGYFRCDGKGDMFSLEKDFSRKWNCTMVKSFTYKFGMTIPYGSKEVEFLSDELTKGELKVFEAWERNAQQNVVNK